MRRWSALLLTGLALAACGRSPAQQGGVAPPAEFVGTVGEHLISMNSSPAGSDLKPAGDGAFAALGHLIAADAKLQVAEIEWKPDTTIEVYVVEERDGRRYAVADVNGDGSYEASESFPFGPSREPYTAMEATITLPLDTEPFTGYELVVGLADLSAVGSVTDEPLPPFLMLQRPGIEGTVMIDDKPVRARVRYDFDSGHASVTGGYQYLDANQDGEFDTWYTSREVGSRGYREPPPIFRVDDLYLSIESVDLDTLQIVLATHPAEEYRRIELEIGNELPDFDFVDLDGNERRLSEFRGKYLLIDVWGMWCAPCRDDVPFHRDAYATFKDRGFEILGLDNEHSDDAEEFGEALDRLEAFVQENEMPWPQAREESVRTLIEEGLRVRAYPTSILLDPDGKIVSLGRSGGGLGLRWGQLDATLQQLLGAR